MTNWRKVHAASREYIRAQAASGLFVASVYAVIGILGLALIAGNRSLEVPLGLLFLAIGIIGSGYFGWQSHREYSGDPLFLTARVARKQDALSYGRGGTLHRYYLQLEISRSARLNAEGDLLPAPYPRLDLLPASEQLFKAVSAGDSVVIACSPAGYAFARLEDLA
jgi:hypothetical protein